MSGPIVMFGTKWPSMTSTWMTRAPALSTASTSSPRREKSADRMDGAMWISCSRSVMISSVTRIGAAREPRRHSTPPRPRCDGGGRRRTRWRRAPAAGRASTRRPPDAPCRATRRRDRPPASRPRQGGSRRLPSVSARGRVHTAYVSTPPGRTQRAARRMRRRWSCARRAISASRRRQRRSAREASVPSPLHGASRSTASKAPSKAAGSSSTSPCTSSTPGTPSRSRFCRITPRRSSSSSTAVMRAPGRRRGKLRRLGSRRRAEIEESGARPGAGGGHHAGDLGTL